MIKTRTVYIVEDNGQEFEVRLRPEENSEKITIKGDKALVSYLVLDETSREWFFDENDCGTFISLDPRIHGSGLQLRDEESLGDAIERLRKENPGRVFLINKYEHGLVRFYRQGDTKTSSCIPDQQWDVSHCCAIFIVPDDCPDPVKYCDKVMEEYTDWCNGDIHGICHVKYIKEHGKWVQYGQSDGCWGYIGYDNAIQTRDEEHNTYVKEYLK